MNAPMDRRFGRAAKFLIYDLDSGAFTVIDNQQNLNTAQGAGVQSAETIVKSGAQALVTEHCGPKAFRVLSTACISVYNSDSGTVAEALEKFKTGRLTPILAADVEGHW